MIIKAEDFKPRVNGVSDLYSWNLYRWMKKSKGQKCRIFKSPRDHTPLVIGWKSCGGDIIGFRLKDLCSGSSNGKFPQQFCYGSQDCPEITEEFYSEYKRIGVCAIHGDWAHDFEYLKDGSARMCKHCGKIEKKKVEMVEQVSWECVE